MQVLVFVRCMSSAWIHESKCYFFSDLKIFKILYKWAPGLKIGFKIFSWFWRIFFFFRDVVFSHVLAWFWLLASLSSPDTILEFFLVIFQALINFMRFFVVLNLSIFILYNSRLVPLTYTLRLHRWWGWVSLLVWLTSLFILF